MTEINRAFQIVAEAPDELGEEELQGYYDEVCGGDEELRAAVANLQAAQRAAAASDFLEYSTLVVPEVVIGGELPGTLLGDGRYKLLQQIGEGGFGIVYMAEQLGDLKRRVAIKIVKPGMDSRQVIARFEAERQALARMDHPNIAKVFEAGATENGRPYFVMELVHGVPITTFCEEHKLDKDERLALFIDVCHAVQHAHQKGVIHRDLKPSNVMITMHDDKAVPKVIDFGVAKATQGELTDKTVFTRYEQLIGTPAYMSPEQAQMSGLDVDTRSDIYALGVLLYELLTGTTPFTSQSLNSAGWEEIRRIIREEDPPKPSTRLRTITLAGEARDGRQLNESALRGDLDWIVMKALEKDRARRYDTATGLAADVQRHLADEPVLAAAPTPAYRLGKFVRKHRPTIVVTVAIAGILLIGSVVSTRLALEAIDARQAEENARVKAEQARGEAKLEERFGRHQLAERFFAAGDLAEAVAQLVKLVREKREDPVATERLVSAFAYRDFPEKVASVEAPEPDSHARIGETACFIQGGRKIVLPVPPSGKLAVWDSESKRSGWITQEGTSWSDYPAISPDGLMAAVWERDWVKVYQLDVPGPVDPLHTLDLAGAGMGALSGRGSRVWSMWFDSTGRKLLAAGASALARVWDLESGDVVVYEGHYEEQGRGVLYCAALHPSGRWALTGGQDAHFWDTATGEKLASANHGEHVWSVAFSPDGRYAATASGDGTARVWTVSPEGRLEPCGPPLQHEGRVNHVIFSPDSSLVATSSLDRTAQIWDVGTGLPLGPALEHSNIVLKSRFNQAGTRLATSGYSGHTHVWDVGSGRQIGSPFRHNQPSNSASFDEASERLLTTSLAGGATLWKAPRVRPSTLVFWHQPDFSELHYWGKVNLATFCREESALLTADRFDGVRLWDARNGQTLPLNEPGQALPEDERKGRVGGYETWADISSDGNTLVVSRRLNGPALVCDLGVDSFKKNHLDVQHGCYTEISPDGNWFLISGQQLRISGQIHTTRLFRMPAGDPVDLVGKPLNLGEEAIARADNVTRTAQARFSPDSQRIATPAGSTGLRIWTVGEEPQLQAVIDHFPAVIEHFDFHPDPASRLLVTGGSDGRIQLWDTDTGARHFKSPPRHSDAVRFVQFSPDGGAILSASDDGTARLWDATTGELKLTMQHGKTVTMAIFSPDGRRVATASYDHSARVWDAQTGLPVSEPLHHDNWVYWLEFNSDGSRLATAGFDATSRIWEIPKVPLPAPDWFLDWCEAVAGKRVGADGVVSLIDWDEISRVRKDAKEQGRDDFYGKLVEWYDSDIDERTVTPFSDLTLDQYVANALEANTIASLEEAVLVDPDNAAAYDLLEKALRGRGSAHRADYYRRLARQFGDDKAE